MMLLSDASRGALRKKGTDGDERANEPPSSYQNSDEPYPWGTWARQRVLLRCHAPNTFGTVNMECTVDSRLSWSER